MPLGGKKIRRWRTLNGNQPSAHKEPTFLAGGGGGEEKLFDGWGGKRSKRWKTAAGARRREECEIATKGISLADGRGRLMTSMVEEFFPPKFFKIVAEFSKISRGIARRRRDYYLKPGKCEWLG